MSEAATVRSLTTYAHVSDMSATIEFYRRLGFEIERSWHNDDAMVWALLASGDARLMIAQADAHIDPNAQAVLFYCHTDDVQMLHQQLVEAGIRVGSITHPDHMPHGEIRILDPDGYVVLIGQLEPTQGG